MGWVGLGPEILGWVGLGFEKVTHDQLCCAPPLRGALYKKWGGTIKIFFRRIDTCPTTFIFVPAPLLVFELAVVENPKIVVGKQTMKRVGNLFLPPSAIGLHVGVRKSRSAIRG